MKIKLSTMLAALAALFVLTGCSSSDSNAATPEQKKAFAGSAPPSNYMGSVNAGADAAKKAAADAAAKNGK